MGRDITQKKTVVIEYQLGFERMIREAVKNFRKMGLEPIFYRAAVESLNRRPNGKRGYFGASANKQYDYDHRYDSALYMGNAFKERKLSILKAAYEQYSELASWCAGPAVVETFGEEGFTPVNKKTALGLNDHQQELTLAYANESRQVINQYMPGDETSFTIIAFPKPEIGPDFEDIFRETIAINTLDYEKYQKIQQKLIDALDKADHVEITGRDGNETSMKVQLHTLTDPAKQTNFENCVSDVNIPLGEVFTSPVLTGTQGILHVKEVYVEDYLFKDLRMVFKDGKPFLAIGAAGGPRIITGTLQGIVNAIDFDMTPEQLVNAPYINCLTRAQGLEVEYGISGDTRKILEEMGHKIVPVPVDQAMSTMLNSVMCIDGEFYAAGTKRVDGCGGALLPGGHIVLEGVSQEEL